MPHSLELFLSLLFFRDRAIGSYSIEEPPIEDSASIDPGVFRLRSGLVGQVVLADSQVTPPEHTGVDEPELVNSDTEQIEAEQRSEILAPSHASSPCEGRRGARLPAESAIQKELGSRQAGRGSLPAESSIENESSFGQAGRRIYSDARNEESCAKVGS